MLMLFHRVSLLTLGLVIGFNLQAQILILPDNSKPVDETPYDQPNQVPTSPINAEEPNPAPETKFVQTPPAQKPPPSDVTIIKTKNSVQVVNPRNKPKTSQADSSAAQTPKPEATPARKKTNRDSFVLGFDMRQYKYEEPDFVTHTGFMFGATGEYLMVYPSGELNLNTELLYGKLNYSGSITESDGMGGSTTRPIEVTNTDLFSKSNVLWQWTPLGYGSPFALKFGLGYRYLSDNYTDRGFYRRDGLWIYVPVGVGLRSRISSEIQINFDLTYQHIVYGGIDSKLTETGITGIEDVYLKQTGHGLEIEAGLVYQKTYHISAYFEGWYMGDSETVTMKTNSAGIDTVQEPANSAISYGIKLGYDLF